MATSSEPITFAEANSAQRGVRRFASSGPGSWVFARVAHHLDRPIYRLSDGKHTAASLLARVALPAVSRVREDLLPRLVRLL